MTNESQSVERVADELEIRRLLARVAHAADDMNFEAYRACFAAEVLCLGDDGWQPVAAEDYARRAVESVATLDWTHHQIGNVDMVFTGPGTVDVVTDVVVLMQWTPPGGEPEHLTVGGRYDLGLARQDIGWRIVRRHRSTRYTIGDPGLVERALNSPR